MTDFEKRQYYDWATNETRRRMLDCESSDSNHPSYQAGYERSLAAARRYYGNNTEAQRLEIDPSGVITAALNRFATMREVRRMFGLIHFDDTPDNPKYLAAMVRYAQLSLKQDQDQKRKHF